jgi:hypothetical protein
MVPKLYKIKHKPTGLYFTPSKGSGTLSTNGKVYNHKPLLSWCSAFIVINSYSTKPNKKELLLRKHFEIPEREEGKYFHFRKGFHTPDSDWEIEEL